MEQELDPFAQAYWRIQALDKRRREYRGVGWVYILRNPALKDALLKIGMTRRWPGERLMRVFASLDSGGAHA